MRTVALSVKGFPAARVFSLTVGWSTTRSGAGAAPTAGTGVLSGSSVPIGPVSSGGEVVGGEPISSAEVLALMGEQP
ncbi:MAG: hypothetical protein OXS29_20145 [bacterium]|nr:hypothetical protein [bacterium]MDE0439266.1 hypothetical protein [bacterium]